MSLFGNILEKLGLKHDAAPTAPAKPAMTAPPPAPQAPPTPSSPPQFSHFTRPESQGPPTPKPISDSAPAPQAAPVTPPPQQVVSFTPPPQPVVSPTTPPPQQVVSPAQPPAEIQHAMPQPQPVAQAPSPTSTPIPMVDVVSKLNHMAAQNPQQLDWKVSIVDLLKLLGLDSSYAALKEMAIELGCPPELMHDSAAMNTWLHKTVLQKLAENGGNIPKELLN